MKLRLNFIRLSQAHLFTSILPVFGLLVLISACSTPYDNNYRDIINDRHRNDLTDPEIQPYSQNPWYWQYQGEPVLLLGASDQDNLFNHPELAPNGLEAHLDELTSILPVHDTPVMFYVRNTMSSRNEGPNVWWFDKNDSGVYDLESMNKEYWNRFDNFLRMTAERDIIVQIELWDRFDFARDAWDLNPFNPKNNINYSSGESGLPTRISSHPGQNENPFFYSVPDLENNVLLLEFQKSVIEKVLEFSLGYEHVLYTISNETSGSPVWSEYWAKFIRQTAHDSGKAIEVTEMWDAWDLTDEEHGHTFNNPELYSFVDISQNGHQDGQTHWDNMQKARDMLSFSPRPMNTVKIYGADNGYHHGTSEEKATRRLWRNIFGGLASSRFHRPPHGIGLGETAKTHILSASMLVNEMDVFSSEPANELLNDRRDNEAYVMADTAGKYAVYFPEGGSVVLQIDDDADTYSIRRLNILQSQWEEVETVSPASGIRLIAPDNGQWVVLVEAIQ